ncbi:DUF1285 domain-containing protein [Shewanella marinintestina]|uniref:DUF1285 domain-containing protein n=1 Tax=Shewanella marinintestina TaxID=190305 RepID=UPI0020104DE5|nr:DUF1285 domain-containing protein [Shewanella marinintestina]MCL1144837.1 DUF1285 domain-containing protein [Shewanella marinintestina]
MSKGNLDHKQVTEAISSLTSGASLCSEEAIFVITDSGEWFYQGGKLPIKFCKLFASILHRIEQEYFLITPVEKLKVSVATQALILVDYDKQADGSFWVKSSINTEHKVESLAHFVVADASVILQLEKGVEARLNRACFYRFIDDFVI